MTTSSIVSAFPLCSTPLHLQAILIFSLPSHPPSSPVPPQQPCWALGLWTTACMCSNPCWSIGRANRMMRSLWLRASCWNHILLPPHLTWALSSSASMWRWGLSLDKEPLLRLIQSTLSKESEWAGSEELQEGARTPRCGSLLVWFNNCPSTGILSSATL